MEYLDVESLNMSTNTIQKVPDDENGKRAATAVKKKLIDIEKKMSFYLEKSEVSLINKNSGIEKVKISTDTLNVINESIKYGKLSNGIFDITMGPVIKKWGIFSSAAYIPSEEEIRKIIGLVNYNDIEIDNINHMAGLKKSGQMIDLGGIAKGYATDEAIRIYKTFGINSAMINIGGNVSVLGRKNDELWNVGIQNPYETRGEIIAVIKCENQSVVTSGNYVRNNKISDKVYGHIINSKSGHPIENDMLSVTVISDSAIEADALSTILFSLDLENAKKFLISNSKANAIFITKNNEVYISKGIKERFFVLDNDKFKYFLY